MKPRPPVSRALTIALAIITLIAVAVTVLARMDHHGSSARQCPPGQSWQATVTTTTLTATTEAGPNSNAPATVIAYGCVPQ